MNYIKGMNNRIYIFRWRRKGALFWKKQLVDGHEYQPKQRKMVLYYPNGSIREICDWLGCECKLGVDWVLATKETIKDEAGQ